MVLTVEQIEGLEEFHIRVGHGKTSKEKVIHLGDTTERKPSEFTHIPKGFGFVPAEFHRVKRHLPTLYRFVKLPNPQTPPEGPNPINTITGEEGSILQTKLPETTSERD
jgi:hypothetical protein